MGRPSGLPEGSGHSSSGNSLCVRSTHRHPPRILEQQDQMPLAHRQRLESETPIERIRLRIQWLRQQPACSATAMASWHLLHGARFLT